MTDASRSAAASRPVVCQVLHTLNVGGAEILAANLARRLQDRFEFIFACLDEPGSQSTTLEQEGFHVEVIGRRSGVDWQSMKRLATLWSAHDVQLIHAHQYTPFFYSTSSGIFRRRPPVLFTEHGRWHPDVPSRKRIFFNRLMLRKRDRVVGVGEHVRQALILNEGLPAGRVGVVYNGVNLHDFNGAINQDQTRKQVRAELGIAEGTPVVLQVARLDALKDHLTAVKAMAEVVRQRPEVLLLLAGDGPERVAIEAEIQRKSLGQSVRLLGTRQDVDRLLKAADVFLLSSVSEGIPLTVIEAMAAGLPVVSTRVGGVPEVVVSESTGLLVPPKSPTDLAAAVMRLVDDPTLRSQYGEKGQSRAKQRFSDDEMNENYARLYEEMLQASCR